MDHDARRRLLRALPAALHALVVTRGRGDATAPPHATLVSWVTQVSFEPPLVAVALERTGTTLPLVERAGAFTLAPLDAGAPDALALARRIGRAGAEAPDKDAGLAVVTTPAGVPALARGVLGWLACRVVAVHAAGDHALVVAAITDVADFAPSPDAAPLTAQAAGWSYAG